MKAHFEMMAAYNAWANGRVAAMVHGLSDTAQRADLGAFFRSIHGTLNHLVVADRIWLARFHGTPAPDIPLNGILYKDSVDLATARRALDAEIVDYVRELDDAALAGTISYTPVTIPEPVTQPLSSALAHFFNHQTHHRGQIHAMMTRQAGEAAPLDLLFFQRERAQ
ncbi:MAG: DinB family protein [Pseudomonadota bacterium]